MIRWVKIQKYQWNFAVDPRNISSQIIPPAIARSTAAKAPDLGFFENWDCHCDIVGFIIGFHGISWHLMGFIIGFIGISWDICNIHMMFIHQNRSLHDVIITMISNQISLETILNYYKPCLCHDLLQGLQWHNMWLDMCFFWMPSTKVYMFYMVQRSILWFEHVQTISTLKYRYPSSNLKKWCQPLLP